MTDVDLYVRKIDGTLGGPLYSTLDLLRLLRDTRTVRLVVEDDVDAAKDAAAALGLGEHEVLSSAGYRSTSDHAPVLHLQHVFDLAPMRLASFAREAEVRTVLSPRGALDEWSLRHHAIRKMPARVVMKRWYWSQVDGIHCTAALEAQQVSRLVPLSEVHVVPNVVSMAWTSTACEVRDQPRALYLSRLHSKKRPDLAIRGLAPLLRDGSLELLTIAGSGTPRMEGELRTLAESEGISSRVNFVGQVDEAGCRYAYENHEILVLPTSQENFGRVLFEALSYGLAVFVPDVVDSWPELATLGATRIEQDERSIRECVGHYVHRSTAERTSASAERRSRTVDSLSRERLLASYNAMYAALVTR